MPNRNQLDPARTAFRQFAQRALEATRKMKKRREKQLKLIRFYRERMSGNTLGPRTRATLKSIEVTRQNSTGTDEVRG